METQATNMLEFDEEVHQYLQEEWSSGINELPCDGPAHEFNCLLTWLATPPKFTTLRYNTLLEEPDNVVTQVHEAISKQYEEAGHVPPNCSCHPQLKDLVIIPNEGPRNLKEQEKEVIVGLACGMAVLRGADVYAQGIMAAPSPLDKSISQEFCSGPSLFTSHIWLLFGLEGVPGSQGSMDLTVNDNVSVYADVEGKVRKGLVKRFTGKRLYVGNGTAFMDRSQIFSSGDKPSGLAIRMTEPLYLAPSLSGLMPSIIFPQNLPSVVCSHVLGPNPGETILDMCAAPGGKTTHIATLMQNKGRVVAFDKSKGKIKMIEKIAAAWDIKCIEAYHFDGVKALDPEAATDGGPPYPPQSFDKIMLDAPCSALGQRPAFRNQMKLAEIKSYSPLQRKLFSSAWNLLRTGGTLVYSTCTWTMEENEKMVAWALKTFDNIKLMPQRWNVIGAKSRRYVHGLLGPNWLFIDSRYQLEYAIELASLP